MEGRSGGLGVRWPVFKHGSPASQLCDLGKVTTSLTCSVFPSVNWRNSPDPGLLVSFSQDLISRGTWQSLACSQAMASLLLMLSRGCHLKGTSVGDALEGNCVAPSLWSRALRLCSPGPAALLQGVFVSKWPGLPELLGAVCETELTAAAPTSQDNREDSVTCVSATVPSKTTVCSLNCLICFFFHFQIKYLFSIKNFESSLKKK